MYFVHFISQIKRTLSLVCSWQILNKYYLCLVGKNSILYPVRKLTRIFLFFYQIQNYLDGLKKSSKITSDNWRCTIIIKISFEVIFKNFLTNLSSAFIFNLEEAEKFLRTIEWLNCRWKWKSTKKILSVFS